MVRRVLPVQPVQPDPRVTLAQLVERDRLDRLVRWVLYLRPDLKVTQACPALPIPCSLCGCATMLP